MSPYHTLCLETVLDTVCSYYGITRQEFYSPCREKRLAWPRGVAASIFCSITNGLVADHEIATAFNRERTSIHYMRNNARHLMHQHPRLAKEHAALLGDAYTKIMQAEEKERMEA